MRNLLVASCLTSLFALSACGSTTCKDLCEKPCNGVSTAACRADCEEIEGVVGTTGCDSEYDSMISCAGSQSDADRCSDSNTECRSEAISFAACVFDYCMSHMNDPGCQE